MRVLPDADVCVPIRSTIFDSLGCWLTAFVVVVVVATARQGPKPSELSSAQPVSQSVVTTAKQKQRVVFVWAVSVK